jgi:hypothetical protein
MKEMSAIWIPGTAVVYPSAFATRLIVAGSEVVDDNVGNEIKTRA